MEFSEASPGKLNHLWNFTQINKDHKGFFLYDGISVRYKITLKLKSSCQYYGILKSHLLS